MKELILGITERNSHNKEREIEEQLKSEYFTNFSVGINFKNRTVDIHADDYRDFEGFVEDYGGNPMKELAEWVEAYEKSIFNTTPITIKKVTMKSFVEWLCSDENDEGFSITQKAINNFSGSVINSIQNLFDGCGVIPIRITSDFDDSNYEIDLKVNEEVILIK